MPVREYKCSYLRTVIMPKRSPIMEKFVISKSGIKVYKDYRDNVTIDRDNLVLRKKAEYPREKYTKGAAKGLSRFGSENSEDIKSWNLFRALQLNNQINKYYEAIGVQDNLNNVLFWGLDVTSGLFDPKLKQTLDEIEPPNLWKIQQTEPDVVILGERTVIFNESKLGRAGALIEAWNRKTPFSKKHKLYKQKASPYFKMEFIDNFNEKGRRYYQLMRNYIVGSHYAKRLCKEFYLVTLASSKNSAKSGLSHQEEFNKFCFLLKNSSNCHFLTWEEFNI